MGFWGYARTLLINLVARLNRVRNLEVQNTIDVDFDVILCDGRLPVDVEHLLHAALDLLWRLDVFDLVTQALDAPLLAR